MRVWEEPVRGGYPDPRLLGYSGIEQLRAYFRGLGPRPPISYLTGMLLTQADEERAVFEMPASDWFLSSQEHISAGALTMLADSALGCAAQLGLPPATALTTAELSMTFLAPCPAGGTLRAVGEPLHMGSPLALTHAWVEDGRGRRVAYGTSSCYVMQPMDGFGEPEDLPKVEEPMYSTPHPYEREARGSTIPWETWRSLSGLEILNGQIDGALPHPPVHHLTGMTLSEVSLGTVSFSMPAHEWLSNPLGTVQGGSLAMLAHAALATAVTSTLDPGAAYRPVDVKVNFLRPVKPDGRELSARGVVTHRGRTLAVATADVFDPDGKKVVTATGSTMILPERLLP